MTPPTTPTTEQCKKCGGVSPYTTCSPSCENICFTCHCDSTPHKHSDKNNPPHLPDKNGVCEGGDPECTPIVHDNGWHIIADSFRVPCDCTNQPHCKAKEIVEGFTEKLRAGISLSYEDMHRTIAQALASERMAGREEQQEALDKALMEAFQCAAATLRNTGLFRQGWPTIGFYICAKNCEKAISSTKPE